MKSLILAVNIGEEEFSPSKISEILMIAFEKAKFNDLVLFLPRMGRNTEEFLLSLSKCCEMLGDSFCTDVFVEEEDKETISFDFLTSLKRTNPNFFVHSKEDEISIGEQIFSCFDLSKYSSDNLDYFLESIYGRSSADNARRNFAISSQEDEKFLNAISSNFKVISKGELQVFARRSSRGKKINQIKENDSYVTISNDKLEVASFINNEETPVLKKVPVSTSKKGKK